MPPARTLARAALEGPPKVSVLQAERGHRGSRPVQKRPPPNASYGKGRPVAGLGCCWSGAGTGPGRLLCPTQTAPGLDGLVWLSESGAEGRRAGEGRGRLDQIEGGRGPLPTPLPPAQKELAGGRGSVSRNPPPSLGEVQAASSSGALPLLFAPLASSPRQAATPDHLQEPRWTQLPPSFAWTPNRGPAPFRSSPTGSQRTPLLRPRPGRGGTGGSSAAGIRTPAS